MNELHGLRILVAVPVLPAPVDDPADLALEDVARPGVGGQAQPTGVVRGRGLGHHHHGPAVLVAPEAVEVLVVQLLLVNAVVLAGRVVALVVDGLGATTVAGTAPGLAGEVLVGERFVTSLLPDLARELDTQGLELGGFFLSKIHLMVRYETIFEAFFHSQPKD